VSSLNNVLALFSSLFPPSSSKKTGAYRRRDSLSSRINHTRARVCAHIHTYIHIQGILFNLRHRSNSKPRRFRWECFKQKYGFKRAIRWCHWFYLEKSFEGHVNVTSNFLNGTPYILLHILIACLESFPKHYNEVSFH